MFTSRGWWLLLIASTILLLGVVWLGRYSAVPPLLGGSVLCWIVWEWSLFQYRLAAGIEKLSIERTILQGGRVTPVLWAGTTAVVRIGIRNDGSARIPLAHIGDRLPGEILGLPEGSEREAELLPGETFRFEYTLAIEAPGLLRFEGATIRVADLAGLFYHRRFLHEPVEYLVLPFPIDRDGRRRDVKRFNVLPPPGVHRLRRAGSGDELHDLRDYRPGDSPKMIAWKASARRDRLITKEFESDVPVRCILFVDAVSDGFDAASRRSITSQMVELSAGILQAAGANRDLVGLTILKDRETTTTLPARSKIHTLKLMKQLSEAAGRIPEPTAGLETIARTAYTAAQELYPERLERGVNARPIGLFWLPIADTRWFVLFLALLALPLVLSRRFALEFLADVAGTFAPSNYSWAVFAGLAILPGTLAGLLWFFHGIRGMLMPRSRRTSRRKQLALLFAAEDGDSPAAVERYLNDDDAFRSRSVAFLREHRIRTPSAARAASASGTVLPALSDAFVRAVGRARDTEVYVLLVDLLDHADDLAGLAAAVRTARARKHRVLIVVPRPKELGAADDTSVLTVSPGELKLPVLLRLALAAQLQRNYERIRRELTRAGGVVLRADEGDPTALILQRLDQVRTARIRR